MLSGREESRKNGDRGNDRSTNGYDGSDLSNQEFVDNYLVKLFPDHALPSDEELLEEFRQLEAEAKAAGVGPNPDAIRITEEAIRKGRKARVKKLIEQLEREIKADDR